MFALVAEAERYPEFRRQAGNRRPVAQRNGRSDRAGRRRPVATRQSATFTSQPDDNAIDVEDLMVRFAISAILGADAAEHGGTDIHFFRLAASRILGASDVHDRASDVHARIQKRAYLG
jgi:hypothetical protein